MIELNGKLVNNDEVIIDGVKRVFPSMGPKKTKGVKLGNTFNVDNIRPELKKLLIPKAKKLHPEWLVDNKNLKARENVGLVVDGLQIPDSYTISEYNQLSPKDQGSYGSCVAHAMTFTMELAKYMSTGTMLKLSTDFIYGNNEVYDNRDNGNVNDSVGDDGGLSSFTALHIAMRYGGVPYSNLPGSHSKLVGKNSIMANKESFLSQGKPNRVKWFIEFYTVEEVMLGIAANIPVYICIDITGTDTVNKIFFKPTNWSDDEESSGHAQCIVGYDYNAGILKSFNSWYGGSDPQQSIWSIVIRDNTTLAGEVRNAVTMDDMYMPINYGSPSYAPVDLDDYDDISKNPIKINVSGPGEYSKNYFGATLTEAEDLMLASDPHINDSSYYYSAYNLMNEQIMLSGSSRYLPIKNYKVLSPQSNAPSFSDDIINSFGDRCTDGLILARADDYMDTALGVQLAKQGNFTDMRYGVALTNGSTMPSHATNYFHTMKGATENPFNNSSSEFAYRVMAGPALLSDSVVNLVEAYYDSKERIYGDNRYTSAVAAGNKMTGRYSGRAILVNPESYADLVCASALAAYMNAPLLYNDSSDTLNATTLQALQGWGVISVFIVGSSSSISSAVENYIDNHFVGGARRAGGSDRYLTSVAIINNFWSLINSSFKNLVIANGSAYDKMASAGLIAAHLNAPVLLCDGNTLPSGASSIISAVKSRNARSIWIGSYGGSMSSSLLSQL